MHTRGGRIEYITHLDIEGSGPDSLGVASSPEPAIEAVVLERPRAPQAIFPTPVPPSVARFHLRVPDDVATILGAAGAHRRGHRGAGVRVAMVDSGWYRHPFFTAHGYDVQPPITVVPATNPAVDPVGHGTGESANIFAIAPEAAVQPIRISDNQGRLVRGFAGFLKAKQLAPHVITNSWGGDYLDPVPAQPDATDLALAVEIRDAISKGIVVVFAAGNGGFSAEAQVQGVIAAGGVFATAGLDLQASDYASGYHSNWFGGVDVPTVSGLVGIRPRASYIMLPIPPGCPIDVTRAAPGTGSGAGDPPDGTGADDGWALFSGTSAATPQVAGAVAVLLSIKPNATPAQVTQALTSTAVDVRAGRCNPRFNNAAGPGRDLATGFGLIDVSAASARI
jgi:subtilisin family serine protease